MVHQLALSQAIDGFLRYKVAAGMSPHTIADCKVSFRKLREYLPEDPQVNQVSKEQILGFFAWLQDGYISEPDGVAPRGKQALSAKSVFNIHTNLSSLWSWARTEGLVAANVVREVAPPRYSPPSIEPITKELARDLRLRQAD